MMDYNYQDQATFYEERPQKAADFRKRAKQALKGFWWKAMLVTLIASCLGGIASGGVGSSFSNSYYGEEESEETAGENTEAAEEVEEIYLTREEAEEMEAALKAGDFTVLAKLSPQEDASTLSFILSFIGIVFAVAFVAGVVWNLFVTSPVKVGYQRFQLALIDGRTSEIRVGTLFDSFKQGYGKSIGLNFCHSFLINLTLLPMYAGMLYGGMQLLTGLPWLYTDDITAFEIGFLSFLGFTLLGALISACISIPVSFAYSMAHIIMADYPTMGAIACLRTSRRMMQGNKWRLFCLDFSFIGWTLVSGCIPVIGPSMVTAYNSAARAVFYQEISGRTTPADVEYPSLDPQDYVID